MPVGAIDRAIAGLLLIVCTIAGAAVAQRTRAAQPTNLVPDLNKRIMAASLMASCGRGWSTPGAPSPNVDAFVNGMRESLSCGEVVASLPTEPLDDFQRSSGYLIAAVAGAWRLAGPSWPAVDWLLGIWFAVTVVLAYATSRFVCGPWPALAVAALLATSPLQLRALDDIRDYSKAPVFLAAFWCVALFSLRPPASAGRVVLAAVVAGAIAGLGYGMRTDTIIILPLLLVAMSLFWPGALTASWRPRCFAVLSCVAVFILLALPVASAANRGAVAAHWAILGLGPDFDRELGVRPGPYVLGTPYDDSVVATVVQAYAERRLGVGQTIFLGTRPYSEASADYYRQILVTFPADMLLRAGASIRRTLDLPFQSDSTVPAVSSNAFFHWRTAVLSRLEGLGAPLLAIAAIVTSMSSLKRALLIGTVAVAMGAYPAVQYQPRHVFQLEFLSLFLLALAAGWLFRKRATPEVGVDRFHPARRAALFALATAIAVIAAVVISRAIQKRAVMRLFESYENAAVVPIALPRPGGASGLSVLEREGLRDGAQPTQSVISDMLVLDIGGPSCATARVHLRVTYAGSGLGAAFNRDVEVPLPGSPGSSRVFQPVFETGPNNPDPELLRLQAVETPAESAACLQRVAKFESVESFALLLPAVLPVDWRSQPLYQRFSR